MSDVTVVAGLGPGLLVAATRSTMGLAALHDVWDSVFARRGSEA
jgi:hypothetical protein